MAVQSSESRQDYLKVYGFATLLTLVVVPALYAIFFGIGEEETEAA